MLFRNRWESKYMPKKYIEKAMGHDAMGPMGLTSSLK
jgi:hypothetical protein